MHLNGLIDFHNGNFNCMSLILGLNVKIHVGLNVGVKTHVGVKVPVGVKTNVIGVKVHVGVNEGVKTYVRGVNFLES